MLSNIVMKNLLFAAWKNSSRHKIGQFEFTRELWDAFREGDAWMCVEHESMPRMIQKLNDEQLDKILASESKTLFVACMNIGHFDTRYQSQGIASAMLEFLKQWAQERGWRRIEIRACPDVLPFRSASAAHFRRAALERRGFRVASETRAASDQAAERREAIERIISGELWDKDDWYVKSYGWQIKQVAEAARDSSWEDEYDKDYVMAYDL